MSTVAHPPQKMNPPSEVGHHVDTALTRRQIHLFACGVGFQPRDVIELRLLRGRDARPFWFTAEQLPDQAEWLSGMNADGWQIFAGINPRLAAGRKGNSAAPQAHVVFADFDGVTVDEARRRIRDAGMPEPTLLIDSGHGVHAYWRLSAPVPGVAWREWQKDLAALLGSDPAVSNEERVMRLPPFLNLKREPYVPCRVIECVATRVYDLADLAIPMRAGSDTPQPLFRLVRLRDNADVGDPVVRCQLYLAKFPGAVSGQKGHRTTWNAANICNRFGVTVPEAMELMRRYSSTRCDPPWSEREIEHKVTDAYTRNRHEHGVKLHEERREHPNPVFAIRRIVGAA